MKSVETNLKGIPTWLKYVDNLLINHYVSSKRHVVTCIGFYLPFWSKNKLTIWTYPQKRKLSEEVKREEEEEESSASKFTNKPNRFLSASCVLELHNLDDNSGSDF